MKILILSGQWFPDYAGGTARVARATAEGLARQGHEVLALVPRAAQAQVINVVDGVEVHRVLRRSHLPKTLTDVYETRRAIRGLSPDRFDVILAHGDICAVAAQAAKTNLPIAHVFHASGVREAQYRRSLGLSRVEQCRSLAIEPFLASFERSSLQGAHRILVLSEFSRRLVLDTEPEADDRLRVVGGGVDTARFTPARDRQELRRRLGVSDDDILLVTARRLVGRMGIEMLLDAFSDLRERHRNIRLRILGEGELRPQLESQRDRLGLHALVEFAGRVDDPELCDWYQAADLFLLPTLAYEGFGMVTVEALASGAPVIGTRVGATGEILARLDERLLADGVDAKSFAATIDRCLGYTDMSFRTRCQEYAADNFGWNVVLRRWETALRELSTVSAASSGDQLELRAAASR